MAQAKWSDSFTSPESVANIEMVGFIADTGNYRLTPAQVRELIEPMTIGDPVSGGTATSVLYIDSDGNLAGDAVATIVIGDGSLNCGTIKTNAVYVLGGEPANALCLDAFGRTLYYSNGSDVSLDFGIGKGYDPSGNEIFGYDATGFIIPSSCPLFQINAAGGSVFEVNPATGEILFNASVGTAGQVLVSGGMSTTPTWGDVPNIFDQDLNTTDDPLFAELTTGTTEGNKVYHGEDEIVFRDSMDAQVGRITASALFDAADTQIVSWSATGLMVDDGDLEIEAGGALILEDTVSTGDRYRIEVISGVLTATLIV